MNAKDVAERLRKEAALMIDSADRADADTDNIQDPAGSLRVYAEDFKDLAAELDAMPYPPFNPDAKCPKCGQKNVSVQYIPKEGRCYIDGRLTWAEHEFHQRHCRDCGFEWREACAEESK